MPPGFVRETAVSAGPKLPPGFVREAAVPSRPPMPDPSGGQPMDFSAPVALAKAGGQAAVEFARDQAPVTATHYRELANLPGSPLGEDVLGLVRRPTPDEEARYRDEVIAGMLSAGGGLVGKAVGAPVTNALKYLGRAGRSVPGLERFIGKNAQYVTSHGASMGSLIAPPLSGVITNEVLDRTNVFGQQSHELAGDTTATGAGIGMTALVTKNTLDDLLLGNERWRELMKKPSAGTATGVFGALVTYLASRGLLAGKDQISDAVDYVAGLFQSEEPPQ